jgi:hypothetical protein
MYIEPSRGSKFTRYRDNNLKYSIQILLRDNKGNTKATL